MNKQKENGVVSLPEQVKIIVQHAKDIRGYRGSGHFSQGLAQTLRSETVEAILKILAEKEVDWKNAAELIRFSPCKKKALLAALDRLVDLNVIEKKKKKFLHYRINSVKIEEFYRIVSPRFYKNH